MCQLYGCTAIRSMIAAAGCVFASACGGGGSSSGSNSSATATNSTASIAAISPTTTAWNSAAFTLTVTGSGFDQTSVVQWNGYPRTTTYVNSNELTVSIPATDTLQAGTDQVTVTGSSAQMSNAVPFVIPCVLAQDTPASTQTRARLGAFYFDGWSGSLSNFHFTGLVNSPYSGREPLSGWQDNTACAVEQQLAWAHAFGLSFFVFDWSFKASVFDQSGEDLNSAFKITRTLANRHGMQYAIAYGNGCPFCITNSADWTSTVQEWVGYMKDPDYVRVNGKPLLVVLNPNEMHQAFGPSAAVQAKFGELRAVAQAQGLGGVTIVACISLPDGAPEQDGLFPDLSMEAADSYDAVTTYGYGFGFPLTLAGAQPFSALASTGQWLWGEYARKSPLPAIPDAMPGSDNRSPEGDHEPGRPLFWFTRTPPEVAAFVNDSIVWAESNPQVRMEPAPAPPMVIMTAWNELGNGAYLVPTVDDGTSFGDAIGQMLATPSAQVRTVLTLSDSGPSDPNRHLSGKLVDAGGAPIANATIALVETPANGVPATYQLSGQVPSGAALGTVALRINVMDPVTLWPGYFPAGPGPGMSNVSVYQVSFVQDDGAQRVVNGNFALGAQGWRLNGQSQIVSSDQGAGQMMQAIASPTQFATLDSALFPIVAGGSFNLSITARIATAALSSGYFLVAFQDASGTGNYLDIPGPSPGALKAESIPFTPGNDPLGPATTDASGSFLLSISALYGTTLTATAAYAGDAQHWPAYVQVSP